MLSSVGRKTVNKTFTALILGAYINFFVEDSVEMRVKYKYKQWT